MKIQLLRSQFDGRTLAIDINDRRIGPDAGPWTVLKSWNDHKLDDLAAAIRAITVDVDDGDKPNGPTEEAIDRLGKALEDGDLARAGNAYVEMLTSSANDCERLRRAAEAALGGDFGTAEPADGDEVK